VKRKGFTLIELLVVVAIIALLISILLPSLARARELTKRSVCMANLRGIGSGCVIYSNDNNEWFPMSYFAENMSYSESSRGEHVVDFTEGAETNSPGIGANHSLRTTSDGVEGPINTNVPISRSLFLTIIGGQCTPKLFTCASSGENEDVMRNIPASSGGSDQNTVAAQPGINRFDFRGYPNLSYGYQMPFGMHGKPRYGMDPRQPLAADKGPAFAVGGETGGNLDNLQYTPEARKLGDMAGSGGESDDTDIRFEQDDEEFLLQLGPEIWRPYNSRNHGGEGQNVLIADGHVEYVKMPTVGLNKDNIYTRTTNWTVEGSLLGKFPENRMGPWVNTDSVLIP
jgi:prepilin-type N-terminal cleavage/methylation domain-containing protein